jgi:hypothetical protein
MEAVGLSDYMTKTASIQVKGNVSTFATYRMCNLSLFRQISHTSNQNTGNVGRITERVQQWIVDQGDHIERLPRDNAKNQRIAMNAERCISRKSGVLILRDRSGMSGNECQFCYIPFPIGKERTIPAVSTISVAKWTLRNLMVLLCVVSMVGSYLSSSKSERRQEQSFFPSEHVEMFLWHSYVSEKVPETKEWVKELLPTARKPRTAIFRWTSVGSFPLFILSIKCIELYYGWGPSHGFQIALSASQSRLTPSSRGEE